MYSEEIEMAEIKQVVTSITFASDEETSIEIVMELEEPSLQEHKVVSC